MSKTAIIIGAGPAGLTAAYELVMKTDIKPIILEMSGDIGGISKTVEFEGNRIDIGGHRFFSKSDRVMDWWQNIMPIQGAPSKDEIRLNLQYQGKTRSFELPENGPDPEHADNVLLIRKRLSRILFLRKFFDYPVSLNKNTLLNLGLIRIIKIGLSYMYVRVFPVKPETSLEDFFINRFGNELYKTFFRDYTEKVWGVPCSEIGADWGAQRIKGLSVTKTLIHAFKQIFMKKNDISQKDTETSLIEQFLYPKYGPGQMWEEVARQIVEKGGELHMHTEVQQIHNGEGTVSAITAKNHSSGESISFEGDYFFSTMPIKQLIGGMTNAVPDAVRNVSDGLVYRDFITVGLLLNKINISNQTTEKTVNNIIPDTWIYIQESDVKAGRLQVFNNWSPYMVQDLDNIWIGVEYFCNEGDELWEKKDDEFQKFAIKELAAIGIIDSEEVLKSIIIRMPKTYPAYFGTYNSFDVVREYVDKYDNLFLVGRNGMHRYNNQDHSMLTAMTAVENIMAGITTKDNIWSVNTEGEYHESKDEATQHKT
jgi:protoporphyrinogen oxidase